jgi:hypothetical protein
LNPTSQKIGLQRWIDVLCTSDRSMSNEEGASEQKHPIVKTSSPLAHRFGAILILFVIYLLQNIIERLFDEIHILNEFLRLIIQFLVIVILLGIMHKLLRYN